MTKRKCCRHHQKKIVCHGIAYRTTDIGRIASRQGDTKVITDRILSVSILSRSGGKGSWAPSPKPVSAPAGRSVCLSTRLGPARWAGEVLFLSAGTGSFTCAGCLPGCSSGCSLGWSPSADPSSLASYQLSFDRNGPFALQGGGVRWHTAVAHTPITSDRHTSGKQSIPGHCAAEQCTCCAGNRVC